MPQEDWSDYASPTGPDTRQADKHGWLPIESAPKEAWLLIGWFYNARWRECIGKYYENQKAWLSYPGRWVMRPTHYQPLAAPPESET